jgi:hypothetical protein
MLVVVADIDAKNVFELAAAEDREPIEALSPRGADPALDVRVGVGRPQRRPDNPYSLAAEDVIAGAAELGVTVVEEKPRSLAAIVEVHQHVASLLDHPGAVGVAGAGHVFDSPAADADHGEHVQPS